MYINEIAMSTPVYFGNATFIENDPIVMRLGVGICTHSLKTGDNFKSGFLNVQLHLDSRRRSCAEQNKDGIRIATAMTLFRGIALAYLSQRIFAS